MLMKSLLLSTGVVSMAVILKSSLPVTLDILSLTNELPYLWSSFIHSWLQPPYLYLLINCIILSIVASSKLHPRSNASLSSEKSAVAVFDEAVKNQVMFGYVADVTAEREDITTSPAVFASSKLHPLATVSPTENVDEVVKNEVVFGYVADDVAPLTAEREELTLPSPAVEAAASKKEDTPAVAVEVEKPRYSARFGNRKLIKGSPEGKTMLKKVSRPKRQETLESTWRTLTEGRPMPLTRHLRKSDTFSGMQQEPASPPVHMIKKSDTFSYGSGGDMESPSLSPSPSPSPGSARKLRREPSLSQDELNRRVEAFIRKFNEEMRLQQRQELFNQYQSGATK